MSFGYLVFSYKFQFVFSSWRTILITHNGSFRRSPAYETARPSEFVLGAAEQAGKRVARVGVPRVAAPDARRRLGIRSPSRDVDRHAGQHRSALQPVQGRGGGGGHVTAPRAAPSPGQKSAVQPHVQGAEGRRPLPRQRRRPRRPSPPQATHSLREDPNAQPGK
jgi:hypothetical protein